MIETLNAAWRARRVLLIGGTDPMTLFMQTMLDELGARCARLVPEAKSETLHRALTQGRICAIIVPVMRMLCRGSMQDHLAALMTLFQEAREAGVPLVILMGDDVVYRTPHHPWHAQEDDPIGGETPEGFVQSILDLCADGVCRGLCGDPVSVQRIRHLPCLSCGHSAAAQYSAWCRAVIAKENIQVQHPSMTGVFLHPLDVCCSTLLIGARFILGDTACTGPFNLDAGGENLIPNRTAALRFAKRHAHDRPIRETEPAHIAPLPLPDGTKARLLCGAKCLISGEDALDVLFDFERAAQNGFDAKMKIIQAQTYAYLQNLLMH